MKVAIMSMQRVINYGSYLQAYSLKHILEQLGAEVEFADYRIDARVGEKQGAARRRRLVKTKLWKCFRRYVLGRPEPHLTEEATLFSAPLADMGIFFDRQNRRPRANLLVIGSDEVFNCLQDNAGVGYSLELFGKNSRAKKQISYAASFGNTTQARLAEHGVEGEIARYLRRFDALSVRDRNSGAIVEALTEHTAQYHLDPVLIGNFDEIEQDSVDIDHYIIVYGYSGRFTAEEGEIIRAYAEAHGKQIIAMCGRQDFADRYICCSPYEILAYFRHADAVITDTFHGSIFSIITHRPFVSVIRDSTDGVYGNREKLEDMLCRVGMEHRIITSMETLPAMLAEPIDFSQSDAIRSLERERTVAYLKAYLH